MKPWGLRVLSNIPSIHQSRRNWMTKFYFFCSVLVLLYESVSKINQKSHLRHLGLWRAIFKEPRKVQVRKLERQRTELVTTLEILNAQWHRKGKNLGQKGRERNATVLWFFGQCWCTKVAGRWNMFWGITGMLHSFACTERDIEYGFVVKWHAQKWLGGCKLLSIRNQLLQSSNYSIVVCLFVPATHAVSLSHFCIQLLIRLND